MENKIILLCDGTIDGVFTAIYQGFVIKNQRGGRCREYKDNIEICVENNYTVNMFAEYVNIETDFGKSGKTAAAIMKSMGNEAYFMVLSALCHFDDDRATAVFGFLVRGFKVGAGVTDMLGDKYVMRIMELSRKVGNEAHFFKEFVRFKEMGGTLYSVISPKCNVIPLIGSHFDDRYPNENWIIYDKKRKLAALHKKFSIWIMAGGDELNGEYLQTEYEKDDEYQQLWKTFYEAADIEERRNERCQNNMIPKWYRENMPEFRR